MLCPHCRAYNPNTASVCDRCAKPLVEPGAAADVTFGGLLGPKSGAPSSGSAEDSAARAPSSTSSSSGRSWPSSAALSLIEPGGDFGTRYHIESQIGEGGMGTEIGRAHV